MKCRITKQGSNCAVLVLSTHHIAESVRRESKFSPIFSPKSSAIAFTPNPILRLCMSATNSVSPAVKPKHHACSAHEKNVRMRAYSGVFCVQLLSPRQASFVPIISIETDLLHARQCRTCIAHKEERDSELLSPAPPSPQSMQASVHMCQICRSNKYKHGLP